MARRNTWIKRILTVIATSVLIYPLVALALVFWPPPEKSDVDNYNFDSIEQPAANMAQGVSRRATMRDGFSLFYRYYPSQAEVTLIILHGSGSESRYLASMAGEFASRGLFDVITPDMRGHGRSADPMGDIDHLGQYTEDLQDLIRVVKDRHPNRAIVLAGHSSGGGMVLRYAGDPQTLKPDAYILLAPYLGHDAPTTKANSGDWVTVAIKRWVGLTMLNNIGVSALNHKPVVFFNRPAQVEDPLQATHYSYRLATSYVPDDYRREIAALDRPTLVLVGAEDEAFYPERFALEFAPAARVSNVVVLEGVNHIGIVSAAASIDAIERWQRAR